ncbi:MAG TPA: hypothetical protein VMY35_05520 [Phycisphaerae bacterium]|nr:hypothetical protein [Phycisphaerae bacterium]
MDGNARRSGDVSDALVSYVLLKLVAGRGREIHGLVGVFAVLFVAMYVARAMVGGF